MSEFLLPSLGADMEAATLVEWNVKPGDKIQRGTIVAAVETDKGIIDIELFEEGVIDALLVQPGEKVPVGAVLATFHSDGETAAPPSSETITVQTPAASQPVIENAPAPVAQATMPTTERQRISPAARRRARELDVDAEQVVGSGPHGAVTSDDIEKFAAAAEAAAVKVPAAKAAAATAAEKSAAGMRRVIAAAMARSKRDIPHYYLSTTIDMTAALTWLTQQNADRAIGDRIVYAVLLLKAVARALAKAPELNGVFVDGEFRASSTAHIGVAISLRQGGLVVPTLRDVDRKDIATLMREFNDLVERARSGHLRGSELLDSTLTVTSLGEQGVEVVYPIIYPPQVAIVGFGAIVERPWAIDGMLAVRRVITATLAADHRVSDGHRGGRFLAALDRLLQQPELL